MGEFLSELLDSVFAAVTVDSPDLATREICRKEYFDATEAEVADPRPFKQVLAERKTLQKDECDG